MQYNLKIFPPYFNAIKSGAKTFEVRQKTNNYQVGDFLILQEWDGMTYSGNEITAKVTYILDDPLYCKSNMVIMAIDVMLITHDEFC